MTYYYLRKNNVIIIDPGYEGGDIHVYKKIKTLKSMRLPEILEEYLKTEELSNPSFIEIKKIGEESIKSQILKPR